MSLRELRQSRGLTQEQLARLSGVHRTVIAKYERGAKDWRNMPLSRALSLADALRVVDLRELTTPRRGGTGNAAGADVKHA